MRHSSAPALTGSAGLILGGVGIGRQTAMVCDWSNGEISPAVGSPHSRSRAGHASNRPHVSDTGFAPDGARNITHVNSVPEAARTGIAVNGRQYGSMIAE